MKNAKKYKKIIKWFLIILLSVLLFALSNKFASLSRGYNAVGGEIFMLLIPFAVWIAPKMKGAKK